MLSIEYGRFEEIAGMLRHHLKSACVVRTERWQGVAANTETIELRSVNFELSLLGVEDLDHWRGQIKPNLPWADVAFEERVCGEPLNPGHAWKSWPWASSAANFIQKRFNHHYNERLWPKFARRTETGELPVWGPRTRKYPASDLRAISGIGGDWYGDLDNLVELLVKQPHTRQAVIPLFYPQDTGIGDGGRKMCSLCYQFLLRDEKLHIWYPLRSCDFRRHFRDDAYLAVRMLLWVLQECRKLDNERWNGVTPGSLGMHMTSLHIFATDKEWLVNETENEH